MNSIFNPMTYESPKAEVMTFVPEGVLCESNVRSNHDGFSDGGSIPF